MQGKKVVIFITKLRITKQPLGKFKVKRSGKQDKEKQK